MRMWEESLKKVMVFGLKYIRVDVWGKFIKFVSDVMVVIEFWIIFKAIKCYYTNLPLPIKFF